MPLFPSSVFFSTDPPPTEIYTLSYTTLFRSGGELRRATAGAVRDALQTVHELAEEVRGLLEAATVQLQARMHVHPERRDRKSTRLNSSHSQISYAVFCLKKKTKQKTI